LSGGLIEIHVQDSGHFALKNCQAASNLHWFLWQRVSSSFESHNPVSYHNFMISTSALEALLGSGGFAVSLARPDGRVLYENELARSQLGRVGPATEYTLLDLFTVPFRWHEIIGKILSGEPVADEPVVIHTEQSDAQTCYLTALPQYDSSGTLDHVLCIWASRKNALSSSARGAEEQRLGYTRDLEALLEHRTYQHLLITEQNQRAKEVLDTLPVGILVASLAGDVLYLNRAMTDIYGLRPANYLKPNIRYFLRPDLVEIFDRVAESGMRRWEGGVDPGQKAAGIDFLPLLAQGTVERIALQFSRLENPVEVL
jgi:PAS domain-containing protein